MGNKVIEIKITKLMYSWTKYGGGRKALVTQERELINYCQTCAKSIPKDYPMYRYEFAPNEYIRVCPDCWERCKNIPLNLEAVIKMVRKVDNLFDTGL